ncbi:MAG: universal stress protein [Acidimicrobiales bacterium]|nr:universal stress protein [Acidimicrobiales bacterium]
MVSFTQVLYPTDLTEASRPAARYAAAVARWYAARLTVLHVVPTFEPIGVPSDRFGAAATFIHPPTRDAVEADVTRALSSEALTDLEVAVIAAAGDPVRTIVEHAGSADLVVMGTHGRSGIDRLLSGSVTEGVFRLAPCPVLAVPPQVATGGGSEAVFRRILCPVDFSPASQRALEWALDLARQANGTLTVVSVVEWLAEEEPLTTAHFNVSEYRQHLINDTRTRLRALLSDESRTWCDIDEVVTLGRAHREVLRLAADRQSDLIVMGAQGRGGVSLALFGSTTPPVVRGAACPVLVVRSPTLTA